MKRYILIILLIAVNSNLGSSKSNFYLDELKTVKETKKFTINTKRADRFFNHFSYIKAIKYYKKALTENPNHTKTKLQIAECYRMIKDLMNAEEWYASAIVYSSDSIESTYKLHYAEILTTNGKYTEAKNWYAVVNDEMGTNVRPQVMLEGLENREDFYRDSLNYFVQSTNINTDEYDFSPSYYKEGIVFSSSRGKDGFMKPTYKWDETSFLDLFYSKVSDDGENYEAERLSTRINSRFHEGPSVFYNNDTKVIFTRNNFNQGKVETSEDGTNKLKLFFSEKIGNSEKWTRSEPFVYNSNEYSVGHPTLSTDGNTLYFSSDMSGGYGKTDIWKCEYQNNAWLTPENLGEDINSAGDEMFPFLKNDEELFFASNGHKGLGGLDLFRTNIIDNKKEVLNLGYPMNTRWDDFGLVMKEKDGFLSSNREGGKGRDDIYRFWVNNLNIEIQIIDSITNEILAGGISVIDLRVNSVVLVDKVVDGVRFSGIKGRDYLLSGNALGYLPKGIDFSTIDIPIGDDFFVVQIPLVKILKGDILVVKNYGMTDQVFKMIGDKIERVDISSDSLKSVYISENRELGQVNIIENVYYDFDKYNIREDAESNLDKLALVLFKYSELKVSFASHTDSRGSFSYNEKLAKRRVNSAEEYVFKKGIELNRVLVKQGFGEKQLINKCDDKSSCDEAAHQLNRRTNLFLSIDNGLVIANNTQK